MINSRKSNKIRFYQVKCKLYEKFVPTSGVVERFLCAAAEIYHIS